MSNHALIQNPIARSHLDEIFDMSMNCATKIISKQAPSEKDIRRVNAYAMAICQSSWADAGIKQHVRKLVVMANSRVS